MIWYRYITGIIAIHSLLVLGCKTCDESSAGWVGKVSGRVTDSSGSPLEGMVLELQEIHYPLGFLMGSYRTVESTVADQHGDYSFEVYRCGTFQVVWKNLPKYVYMGGNTLEDGGNVKTDFVLIPFDEYLNEIEQALVLEAKTLLIGASLLKESERCFIEEIAPSVYLDWVVGYVFSYSVRWDIGDGEIVVSGVGDPRILENAEIKRAD